MCWASMNISRTRDIMCSAAQSRIMRGLRLLIFTGTRMTSGMLDLYLVRKQVGFTTPGPAPVPTPTSKYLEKVPNIVVENTGV